MYFLKSLGYELADRIFETVEDGVVSSHLGSFIPEALGELRVVCLLDLLRLARLTADVDVVCLRNAAQIGLDRKVVQGEKAQCIFSFHFLSKLSLSDLKMVLKTSGLVVSGNTKLIVYDKFKPTSSVCSASA